MRRHDVTRVTFFASFVLFLLLASSTLTSPGIASAPITNEDLKEYKGKKETWIRVVTTPSDATVRVDGKPFGTSPVSGNLTSGTHTVEISREGFKSVRRVVETSPDKPATLSVTLSPAPQEKGGKPGGKSQQPATKAGKAATRAKAAAKAKAGMQIHAATKRKGGAKGKKVHPPISPLGFLELSRKKLRLYRTFTYTARKVANGVRGTEVGFYKKPDSLKKEWQPATGEKLVTIVKGKRIMTQSHSSYMEEAAPPLPPLDQILLEGVRGKPVQAKKMLHEGKRVVILTLREAEQETIIWVDTHTFVPVRMEQIQIGAEEKKVTWELTKYSLNVPLPDSDFAF